MSAAIFDLSSPFDSAKKLSIASDASHSRTWIECSRFSAISSGLARSIGVSLKLVFRQDCHSRFQITNGCIEIFRNDLFYIDRRAALYVAGDAHRNNVKRFKVFPVVVVRRLFPTVDANAFFSSDKLSRFNLLRYEMRGFCPSRIQRIDAIEAAIVTKSESVPTLKTRSTNQAILSIGLFIGGSSALPANIIRTPMRPSTLSAYLLLSLSHLGSLLEVISDRLNRQNAGVLRHALRDLGKRCVFHAGSLRDLLVLAFVLVKHSERVGEKFFLCHERHFIAIYCYLQ